MSTEFALLCAAGLASGVSLGYLLEGVERKLYARLQNRRGPPVLQPLFDSLKLLFVKETLIPENASAALFTIMPYVSAAAVATAILLLPLGGVAPLSFGGDLIVLLYVLALSTVALIIGASASGSPLATVGVSREVTLFIAIELPLVLAVLAPAFAAESFSLVAIGASGAILPLAAVAFFFAALAEFGKAPFDMAEAEEEIAEGIYAEYSGKLLGMLKLAGAMKHYAYSLLFAVLFVPLPAGWDVGVKVAIQLGVALAFMCLVAFAHALAARFRIHQAAKFLLYWVSLLALAQLALVFIW